jgi:hypothetical protein
MQTTIIHQVPIRINWVDIVSKRKTKYIILNDTGITYCYGK